MLVELRRIAHTNIKVPQELSKNAQYFQTERLKNDGAPQILSIRIAVRVEFTKIVHNFVKVPQEVKLHDIFN